MNERSDSPESQTTLLKTPNPIKEEFLKTHDIVNLLQALVAEVELLKTDMVKTFHIGKKWQQRFDGLIDIFDEQASYYETELENRLKSKNDVFAYHSMSKLIYDCVDSYKPQAKDKGIEIQVDLEQFPPQDGKHRILAICMDQVTLRHTFLNAIDNAVKYSFSGTAAYPRWIEITGQFRKQHGEQGYYLEFSNLGVGIEADELDRVFEPGYQSRMRLGEQRSGQGVGLTFVKKAIIQHGGLVSIRSDPQQRTGWLTRLSIWLPLHNREKCKKK